MLDYDLNLLTNYLIKNSEQEEITLTIDEIEKIAGGRLPSFSYKPSGINRFWYNDRYCNKSYAHYWLDACFYAYPDRGKRLVRFSKNPQTAIRKRRVNGTEQNTEYYIVKKRKPNIDIQTAINAIKKYHYSVNENYTRYKSWEHCRNAFKVYRKDESKSEFLCLHLFCYLASWGMMRNSSLMNYDYFVHMDFVKEISKGRYDSLFDDFCETDTVFAAVEAIHKLYPQEISKTDTFVTKILLGVFGCVPAYDRYFKRAAAQSGVCGANFNKVSLEQLKNYYENNKNEFENLRLQFKSEGAEYTPMKMLDMCFWQIGFDNDKNGKK